MFLMPGSRARTLPRQRDGLGYQLTALPTSGNNLIITINQTQGAFDPFLEFRDPTAANGDPFFRPIPNGGHFIINSGSTFATANNVPFRLWVLGFDNGGGITLGAFQSVTGGASPTAIAPLDESAVQTTTGGNGGNSAATFYAAQTLTGRPFRILGYLEWSAGLVTAGVWNAKPTKIQLFGPGIKKPGDLVQYVFFTTNSATTSTSSTQTVTTVSTTITPTAAPNLVRATAVNHCQYAADGGGFDGQLKRGATFIGPQQAVQGNTTAVTRACVGLDVLDAPGSASSVTYAVYGNNGNNTSTWMYPQSNATIQGCLTLQEIMV